MAQGQLRPTSPCGELKKSPARMNVELRFQVLDEDPFRDLAIYRVFSATQDLHGKRVVSRVILYMF